jgi:hypothetical protein
VALIAIFDRGPKIKSGKTLRNRAKNNLGDRSQATIDTPLRTNEAIAEKAEV